MEESVTNADPIFVSLWAHDVRTNDHLQVCDFPVWIDLAYEECRRATDASVFLPRVFAGATLPPKLQKPYPMTSTAFLFLRCQERALGAVSDLAGQMIGTVLHGTCDPRPRYEALEFRLIVAIAKILLGLRYRYTSNGSKYQAAEYAHRRNSYKDIDPTERW